MVSTEQQADGVIMLQIVNTS